MILPVIATAFRKELKQWLQSYYLARVVQTLPDDKVDQDPGQEKVSKQFPPHATHLVNPGADFQDSIATGST